MSTLQLKYEYNVISEQDYLEGELVSGIKHELIDGEVYAMAGTSKRHGRILANLSTFILPHLQHTPCESFTSDMKVKVGQDFFYPDAMVVCDDHSDNEYYTDSPVLIVEVLSKSTRKIDKILKRTAYQSLPSLQEYALIEQDFVEISIFRRATHWQEEYFYLGDSVHFAAIDLTVTVESLYARVDNADMREFLAAREQNNA